MNGAQLLEFLVCVPSTSGNERELVDRLTNLLRHEGFAVEREGDSIWFTLGNDRRPHLLMVSHIDTVPACDGWNSDPLVPLNADGKITGLGANDAKGCVAAMILAARELQQDELDGRVTFAFVDHEETGGDGIRATKPKLGVIDAAVVGEPTSLEICTAQRGLLILRCIAQGEAAHAAHAHLGENAIHKAACDISRLAEIEFERHPQLGLTKAQVTQIAGGTARNQVPDRCEFFVDIRTTPNLDHAHVVATIGAALESDVVVHSQRYEPVATDESDPIVQAALAAGSKDKTVGSVTTSDWAFLKGTPTVKAGPGDTQRSHRPNEYLLVSELDAGARFYSRLAREYLARARKEVTHG
ncbi:MAG TPA: M20/M25/M40 family metallo-hydrolase [Chthoniobacterales bacterium]|nr:M20/M25/M40 family metallo-hydrolase [Chthoniobacterales bacterium]